jgi:hypothetical protein
MLRQRLLGVEKVKILVKHIMVDFINPLKLEGVQHIFNNSTVGSYTVTNFSIWTLMISLFLELQKVTTQFTNLYHYSNLKYVFRYFQLKTVLGLDHP